MHQNIAIILQQLCYGKISFKVLIPGLIKIYGGIHRGQVIEDKAALFASRGFATLALAFFGVKDLPISYAT